MAATQTVAQRFPLRNSTPDGSFPEENSSTAYVATVQPQHGVITLSGFGIAARVDRGHLVLEDGIAGDRRRCRLPRIGHGLKRLVVIGSDGQLSLAALRWLADQDAAFTMLDRSGKVLVTTGPVRAYDARLRRAQSIALHNGTAFRLSRAIIDRKLAGQERVVVQNLGDESAGLAIRQYRSELAEVESIDAIRLVESHAAQAYWSAWRNVTVTFPRKDLPRVPEHWRTFGWRISSLTRSPRLATNPANAILNYLYGLLQAESRLAAATLGLDPGIGVLHFDAPYRDSLACDLMEPIRPDVDAFVLDWINRQPLTRNSFLEQRDGNCRLMDSLAEKLAQTAPTWARLVAPVAEWLAREINGAEPARRSSVPARLTQRHRREAKGGPSLPKLQSAPRPTRVCQNCGTELKRTRVHCKHCATQMSRERFMDAIPRGRAAAQRPEAQAKRSATQSINMRARLEWNPEAQPSWLTEQFYLKRIQPVLPSMSGVTIAKVLNVSHAYANELRKGRIPHARHWRALADLAGIGGPSLSGDLQNMLRRDRPTRSASSPEISRKLVDRKTWQTRDMKT